MAKVTSKLQVTVPKSIADAYGIAPGDDIEFQPAGDVIRIVFPRRRAASSRAEVERRLRIFDAATARQRLREREALIENAAKPSTRGWTREELSGEQAQPRLDDNSR